MKRTIVVLITISLLAALLSGCGGVQDEKPAEEEKIDEEQEEKTLLIGDSLFDLWKDRYQIDLEGLPNLANVAIGGTNSIYWTKNQKIIQRENPTTIIISLGTNDIGDLNRQGKCAALGGDQIETCLAGVLEALHTTMPNAHIYWLTVNICGEAHRWEKRDEIHILNQEMREYCADKDWVDVIETEYAFYDDENYDQKPNPVYFVEDFLHFSDRGYDRLTEIVRKALELDQ